MKNTEYVNAMLESNFYEQIIDEACNGDLGFNNHFKTTLTVGECIHANEVSKVWARYAQTC